MTNTELALLSIDNLASISGGRAGATPAPRPSAPSSSSGSSHGGGSAGGSASGGGSLANVNVGGNIKVDAKVDLNRAIDQVGTGAGRVLGCATGANSRQEFGRCILSGHLDGQH